MTTVNAKSQVSAINKPSTIFYAKEFCYCGNDLFPEFQDKIPVLIRGCIVACNTAFSKKDEYFANIDWTETVTEIFNNIVKEAQRQGLIKIAA